MKQEKSVSYSSSASFASLYLVGKIVARDVKLLRRGVSLFDKTLGEAILTLPMIGSDNIEIRLVQLFD